MKCTQNGVYSLDGCRTVECPVTVRVLNDRRLLVSIQLKNMASDLKFIMS